MLKDEDVFIDSNMPFSVSESHVEMESFKGRFERFLEVSNPLYAKNDDRRIKEFQLLLKAQKREEDQYFKITGSRKMMVDKKKVKLIKIA